MQLFRCHTLNKTWVATHLLLLSEGHPLNIRISKVRE